MFVKICGTTNEQDALLAVALGADAIGFIFAPSTRQVSPQVAADIAKRLPPEVLTVGIFRDAGQERVVEIMGKTGLKAAQLSGAETAEQTKWIRRRVPMVIKGFAAGHSTLSGAADYGADAILVEGPEPGSGQLFDWQLAEGVPNGVRVLLAGGLNADNVARAIAQVRPWGVDVATGVESSPGHKDPRKLRAFIAAAKAAASPSFQGDEHGPYDWQDDA
ncbi:MAG TPA: phosphoribosylanthranilate isomerase [Acidimicrobiales bacterium]|nr:phosphoribosylanthranilate isomerase [Acidimicrobiales bacterium]